jgi:glycerol-3-phosphate dehydrogenase (NAD(P)+)
MTTVSILGAGAWGIGLALTSERAQNDTTLWSYFEPEIQEIKSNGENSAVLPGIKIPKSIHLTSDLKKAAKSNILLFVTPAQAFRKVLRALKPHLNPESYLIICSKGIELETNRLLSEVMEEEAPDFSACVLAGPNFAREVALNLPAAATLASDYRDQSLWLCNSLSHDRFHLNPSTDVKGVELASAVKNVLAIASGLVTGAGLGENARAAVVTYGLNELTQLSLQKGGHINTVLGFSGIGDILLTCMSATSRNMKLGLDLGSGKAIEQLKKEGSPLTEGAMTVKALIQMAQPLGQRMPVCQAVYRVLYEGSTIEKELRNLFSHPLEVSI